MQYFFLFFLTLLLYHISVTLFGKSFYVKRSFFLFGNDLRNRFSFLCVYCIVFKVAFICIQSNPSLASELFISLTKKLGYDKISACTFVPVIKTDYQAYLRKALKILDDMLLLKNMPAEKI